MKRKILWLGLSFLLVLALLLAACGPEVEVGEQEEEEEEEERLRFAYITPGDPGDPFQAAIVRGWQAATATFEVDETVGFGHGDWAAAIDLIDAQIAAGVDGIFVFSTDPDAVHPSIQRAVEKGIEFVVMSSRDPVFGPEQVPFVGFDLEDQGYTLGRHMAAQLEAAGLVSDVNISFFAEGVAPYSVARRGGILSALANEEIGYVASEIFAIGASMAEALDAVTVYLLAHPETDVLIGLGSITSAATVMALQELEFEPGAVKWSGFDLLPETAAGIRAGYGASNVDEVFSYGFLGALTLYLRVEHDLVVGDLPVATVMVDLANIEEFVD